MLRFRSLGSGSGGNATVVESHCGARVTRLLVDAGFALRQLDLRLAAAGLNADQIDAVFITHEHADHLGCAREFALRQDRPLWMSHGTHLAIGEPALPGRLHLACDNEAITLGDLLLHPFTVPHDAREPLQLVCEDGTRSLGILTDLGHVTDHVLAQLAACHALLFECNHDAALLAQSNYPPFLKQRVGGRHGHLSNAAAAVALAQLAHAGLKTVVAAHLSAQNNRPALARTALATALKCDDSDILVADQASGIGWLEV